VSIKPERVEQVDFSDPYFDSGQSLLIRAADAGTYETLADLAGERIAVQAGTTGETYANENKPEGAEIVSFEDADGMFGAIASGDVAAVLQDLPVNAQRAKQDSTFALTGSFPTDEQYAFAVEKGDTAMVEFLNSGLEALRADGRFDEIYGTYFEESE
jgi:polar amino acid transport system substrate-binding protein